MENDAAKSCGNECAKTNHWKESILSNFIFCFRFLRFHSECVGRFYFFLLIFYICIIGDWVDLRIAKNSFFFLSIFWLQGQCNCLLCTAVGQSYFQLARRHSLPVLLPNSVRRGIFIAISSISDWFNDLSMYYKWISLPKFGFDYQFQCIQVENKKMRNKKWRKIIPYWRWFHHRNANHFSELFPIFFSVCLFTFHFVSCILIRH